MDGGRVVGHVKQGEIFGRYTFMFHHLFSCPLCFRHGVYCYLGFYRFVVRGLKY